MFSDAARKRILAEYAIGHAAELQAAGCHPTKVSVVWESDNIVNVVVNGEVLFTSTIVEDGEHAAVYDYSLHIVEPIKGFEDWFIEGVVVK